MSMCIAIGPEDFSPFFHQRTREEKTRSQCLSIEKEAKKSTFPSRGLQITMVNEGLEGRETKGVLSPYTKLAQERHYHH